MTIRHIVLILGSSSEISDESLSAYPGIEVYRIDGPDAENQIEMALLNDLVTPIQLAFVGGEDARRFAELYNGTWIEDGSAAEEELRRFRVLT